MHHRMHRKQRITLERSQPAPGPGPLHGLLDRPAALLSRQVGDNSDFLAANPAAEVLFEAVKLSVIDVSLANVAMGWGKSPTDLAAQWIADNRDLVDEWITAARAAA